jgi:signal transduction histidine kinase
VAPVGDLGWVIMVTRPVAQAFRAADSVRDQTAIWAVASLLLALGLGVALARALTRPVSRLTEAAEALTGGRFDAPLPPARGDELGTLAAAFSHMTVEVQRRDAEIRTWNAELAERVERKSGELKAAEHQIARTRRLTALGSLSAGVAQRLNDPLTAAAGLLSLMQPELGADSPVGRELCTALEQVRRATRVVQDLRRLASPGRLEGARRFQLEASVSAVLDRYRDALATGGVELVRRVAEGLPPMEGDPEQLEALVARLVDNALAAMPGGGQLTVTLSAVDASALRLAFGDTGHGIPAARLERIFDPFFSTSKEGGAGLGLTLAHGIVEAHHGRIDVESEEGRGTLFTIHFPAAPEPPEPGVTP